MDQLPAGAKGCRDRSIKLETAALGRLDRNSVTKLRLEPCLLDPAVLKFQSGNQSAPLERLDRWQSLGWKDWSTGTGVWERTAEREAVTEPRSGLDTGYSRVLGADCVMGSYRKSLPEKVCSCQLSPLLRPRCLLYFPAGLALLVI